MADEQIVTSIVAKADLSSLVSEVHRASASLQQLQRELLASNRAISSSTKLANNLFRDTLSGSGQFSSHFVNLNSDVDKFGKNLDSGRLKLKNYFQTFREHATTQKGMIRELAKEQVMLQNSVLQPLGRNAQGLMQYNVMIPRGLDAIANSGKLARMEMQIMNRALSEGATGLINWGKNTQWAGRQLTVGLTVPLTMFGTAAGKAFREADAELVRLTKVYGGIAASSAADLKSIRDEVVETAKTLSKTMGSSFKDTIALGADIAATGKTGDDLLGSIVETTRLSILGEVDRQDAMKATLAIQTAFKQNTKELTESINFLNAVENQTSTTLADLVEAIPKAGPVIKQLGGSVKDLALYLTAMREGGINASEGANALKSGLASLINPTKQTVGMMSDFGIDVMGMVAKNTGNTTALLLDLQGALDKLDPLSKARALEQMFGKFQFARMSSLLNNLGKEGSQTLQVIDLMKASTQDLASVASRELKMVTESASGKYRRAIEGLKAELADVGEEFLGVATKFINAASKILDFFTGLPAPIKKALTFMAGFTALVGPLIMLTGVLANFFGYITKGVVQLRAFFMKASGWKMLTPEIIAAEKAALMVENAFYSDAAAAQVLHNALQKLVLDYQNLSTASAKNRVPTNPGVSTVGGSQVVSSGRRVVDPTDPYVGDPNTRAMSHINPRDPNSPATIFGGVPGAIPVNRGISRTPQMYMGDRLPNVEGLTSIKGISTGIVPAEAAKFHALMATLGMQTEQEVALLKKTIAMGGTVSAELLNTFDDILPITQKFANSAAEQSALIVQQMRSAEITVEEAKARILALNAQIEAGMGSAVSAYAAGRGRSIDLTKAPMMNQPVVDANGQFTLRDLYKKKANLSVMEEFGRLRGVRTFGAPYSMQATRLPKFALGGEVESFSANKTTVSGPSSIGYDDRLGSVPLGGYVLNQGASMDPSNAPLVAAAAGTYNDGGTVTAALTPKETVFGPKIQRMPELYAAVDAANNGYNFGGQIMNGITGYGKQTIDTPKSKMDERLFKKQYREYLRFINNPRYEDDMRVRMIMLDAAELSYTAKMPMDKAIQTATSNFDSAKIQSGGSDEKFVKIRIKQVQDLEEKYPDLRVKNAKTAKGSNSLALNHNLNDVRKYMLKDSRFAEVHDLISAISPTTFKNKSNGAPSIQGLHDRAHFRRRGELGYMTSGYMGLAAVMPSGINNIMSRLEVLGLSRDVLNLSAVDARENFALALKKTGMDKFATVDDLYAAVMDDGKFKSKAQIESGNVIRANKKQRSSWSMFLQAAATKQRWIPGRPPRLVPAGYNLGGMIPGGSISANRSSYGVPPLSPRMEAFRLAQQARYSAEHEKNMARSPWIREKIEAYNKSTKTPLFKLLSPEKQLKILGTARSIAKETADGPYGNMAPTEYGHQISASTGMSYPIPGVSGLYKDAQGNLKFFKGVPNQVTALTELYGTKFLREVTGIEAPEMTIKTILNPLDSTRKTKLLGMESPYDKRFAGGGTKFTEDEMIRQSIASYILNDKDLSMSNVYGNFRPDVGAGGVLSRASGATEFAKKLPSMKEQAMINLLGVKGGARKDFAVNTAPLAASMTARKYGRKMKSAMEEMHPKFVKFVKSIPKEHRAPYIRMLKRFEEGMDVNWSEMHPVHIAAKRNSGGPVGGSIQRGRHAYGRPGNPAARAAWEAEQRAQRERDAAASRSRAASHQMYGQQALTSGLGRQAVRTGTTSFYNPGQVMVNNMVDPFKHSAMMKARYLQAAFNTTANAATKGATSLAYGLMTSGTHIKQAYQEFGNKIMISGKAAMQKIKQSSMLASIKSYPAGVRAEIGTRLSQAYPGQYSVHPETNKVMNNMTNRPVGIMSSPGLIGKWSNPGQEGVQTRKVGSLGFRRTEYMVNNAMTDGHTVPMTAAQAKASGVNIQRPGSMGMGAQMGIGMAGSMGGMALMGKEKIKVLGTEMSGMTAGFGLMAASSILPMLPWIKWFDKAKAGVAGLRGGFTSIMTVMKSATLIGEKLINLLKGLGPIGIAITAVMEGFRIYKKVQDDWQDARMGLSMTAKAAEQAGVKYFNLQETMQGYLDKQKLLAAGAKASAGNSIGMPGLPRSIEEMKKAKEEGKGLKDLIESLNRSSSTEETQRLVNNQKAQMVSGGMSIEEANKKIYGALANSKKSGQSYKLLADEGFGAIVDKATSAEFAVGNLINTLNKGAGTADWHKEVGNGFEGLIGVFQNSMTALVGTKDALGNVIDEYEAYQQIMSKTEKNNPKMNDPMGKAAYDNLANTQPLLASITNEADSITGVLAKWKLYTSGVNIDLSKIDSTLAQKLAGFTAAIGTGISELTKAADGKTTYGRIGTALLKLQKIISATSAASQRAAAASQRSAQEELKVIAKKIRLIEDEKNKKLESLRATQDASNYALELQKLQIEYADAISRGDMTSASQAALSIDQLTLNRQTELAQKAIEDAANKAKAPLEKQATTIQEKSDKKTVAFQNAQDNSASSRETVETLTKFQTSYNDLTTRSISADALLNEKDKKVEQSKIAAELVALLKEVQAAGTGKGAGAAAVRESFAGYFDKNGKPIPLESTLRNSLRPGDVATTTTPLKSVTDIFQKDVDSVSKLAIAITGNVTIAKLRDDLLKVLGKPNNPNVQSPVVIPKDDKHAGQYAGGSYMSLAQLKSMGVKPIGATRRNPQGTYVGSKFTASGIDYQVTADAGYMGFAVKKLHHGGSVIGAGTETSDSIPAYLSDGEYVIKASSVKKYGIEHLNAMNAGKYADGGPVGKLGTASSMIKTAESMLGYREGKNNDTLFGRFAQNVYDLKTKYIAWCGAFINWAAKKSGVDLSSMIWTPGGAQSFKSTGKWTQNPVRGDLAFMNFPGDGVNRISHVGLVRSVLSKNAVSTIEGNTASYGNQRLGGGVFIKTRKYNEKGASIVGFGRPSYKPVDVDADNVDTDNVNTDNVQYQTSDQAKLNYENSKYTVKRGDTLFAISKKYGIPIKSLIKMNLHLNDPKYKGGSKIFAGTELSIKKFASGGKVKGGPARQQLPNFPWRPDMPNYWSNGKPSGSPWTGRWGELRYNPSKGKDIWGGTEPGGHFTGNIKDKSDYWHQMGEQPSKYRGPGMGIDKDPMRYAGSGASMGGIGNGVYGLGPLMFAEGGPIASWMKPKSPYNSKGKPTGSPYGRYWGELERLYQQSPLGFDKNGKPIFNNAGKDPWGGTEPGKNFHGKIPQFSDYMHQLGEQPSKYRGPGMGIDKDPMRYAGSGASMGGIGNGVYGLGPLMFAMGGSVKKQSFWNKLLFGDNTPLKMKDPKSGEMINGTILKGEVLFGPASFGKMAQLGYELKYSGEGSLHVLKAIKEGKEVAHLTWDKITNVVEALDVTPLHRLKGLATAMYKSAKEISPITHSSYRTPAGDAFAHKVGDKVAALNDSWLPGDWSTAALQRAAARAADHIPSFKTGINMVPANMLARLHKNEAVIPANMNPFNPSASAPVSGSVYNINVELNGTNVTAQDVATQIHKEMRLKEMAAGINRKVGSQ